MARPIPAGVGMMSRLRRQGSFERVFIGKREAWACKCSGNKGLCLGGNQSSSLQRSCPAGDVAVLVGLVLLDDPASLIVPLHLAITRD